MKYFLNYLLSEVDYAQKVSKSHLHLGQGPPLGLLRVSADLPDDGGRVHAASAEEE